MTADRRSDASCSSDALYARIVSLLNANRVDEALACSHDLMKVDADRRRASGILALVHLEKGDFQETIRLIEAEISELGESGPALTNLSKAYYSIGDRDRALATSRRALQLDPNQNAGLIWYLSLKREHLGAEGAMAALDEVAQAPGSWRALLWQARDQLDRGALDDAVDGYRRALSLGCDSDALLMISGDLGGRGFPEQAIGLVADRYDPDAHSPHVGLNLLEAYLTAGRREEGERLLHTMHRLGLGQLGTRYAEAFAKLA